MNKSVDYGKVSVIIPTFNRATFLPNSFQSIIDQQYPNLEIIIVDDGSTDNTHDVVNALKRKYENIIYLNNERSKGPSGGPEYWSYKGYR